jgi:hypothetical protein
MANLGRKYTCYSCHTKFYDLGKPTPLCPKCGADQRHAEEAPVYTSSRSRSPRVVEEPPEEEFEAEIDRPADTDTDEPEEEDVIVEPEEDTDDDDEEEL